MRKKKDKAALALERAYQAAKSHANKSAWHEYAVMMGADALAVYFIQDPKKFSGGTCAYQNYKEKARFRFDLARAVRDLLAAEGNSVPDHRTGGSRPLFDLANITDAAVEQMLKPSVRGNKRALFEAAIAHRLAVRTSKPAQDDHWPEDLREIAASIDALMGQ